MANIATVTLRQEADYRFAINFGDNVPVLYGDEPPPLGRASGPTPLQLLAAAVGDCLASSLLFALRKFRQKPEPIGVEVKATVDRDAAQRLRVTHIDAVLTLGVPASALEHLDRVLAQFEEFCTVTQSVRQAFPVVVSVLDADGKKLK